MDSLLETFSVSTRMSVMTGFAEVLTFHQVTCLSQINQSCTSQLLNGNKLEECCLNKKVYKNLIWKFKSQNSWCFNSFGKRSFKYKPNTTIYHWDFPMMCFYEQGIFKDQRASKAYTKILEIHGGFWHIKTCLKCFIKEHSPKPHTLHTPELADYTGLFTFTRSRS